MASKYSVKVQGVDAVMRKLGKQGAQALAKELDTVTGKHTAQMANKAAENAPRRDGHLKNSIISSVTKEQLMTWRFGSDRPYATRQEYEHKTNKGFFRKALWNGRKPFRDAINKSIKDTLK